MVNLVPIGWKNGQPQRLSSGEKISSTFLELPESGASENVLRTFTQSGHGFSVGSQIRPTSSGWVAAQGNTIPNCTNVWTVISTDGADVTACKVGRVGIPSHGLGSNNTLLYLSATSAGDVTSSKPVGTLVDHLGFYLPVIFIEDANNIHVLGKSYPCLTNILGRRVLASPDYSVDFQNVNFSKGAKIRISANSEDERGLGLTVTNGTIDANKCDTRRSYSSFIVGNAPEWWSSLNNHPLNFFSASGSSNFTVHANLLKFGEDFFVRGDYLDGGIEVTFKAKFGFSATPPSLINFNISTGGILQPGSTFELLQEIE